MPEVDNVSERYRYCPGCGREAAGDAAFCAGCGQSLVNRPAPTSADPTPTVPLASQPTHEFTEVVTTPTSTAKPPWAAIAALIGAGIGLLMPWASAFIVSVSGIDTDDGKLFGVILLIAAVLTWRRRVTRGRVIGVLCVLVWLALFAIAVYEIVHISSVSSPVPVSVGTGLYVAAIATLFGTFIAAKELGRGPI